LKNPTPKKSGRVIKLKERKHERIMNNFKKALMRRHRILGSNYDDEVEDD
jgi:hypothetical protein